MAEAALSDGTPETAAVLGLSWPLLVSSMAFLLTAASRSIFSDADTLWHLATARWILANRAVPTVDTFSHTAAGTPWTAHEWGSEVLMGMAYNWLGWPGLHLLTALAFAATIAYLTRRLLESIEPLYVLVIVAFSIANMSGQLLARPHVLAWPITAWWVGSLSRSAETGTRPNFWLLPAFLCWVNLHGSFVLGLGLAGFFMIEAIIHNDGAKARQQALRRWLPFVAIALLLTAANPRGFGSIVHTLHMMQMPTMLAVIDEWQSANFHVFQPVLLLLFPLILLAFTGTLRVPLWRGLLVMGLIFLSLKHQRYHSLLGLLLPMVLCSALGESIRQLRGDARDTTSKLDTIFRSLGGKASQAANVGLWACLLVGAGVGMKQLGSGPRQSSLPTRALDFVEQSGITGNVFNSYGFGGFLVFRGVPTFIDGRADMFGEDFLKRYGAAITASRDGALEQLLERYDVTWTLLEPRSAAALLLDRIPEWERVYSDTLAVVHARTVEPN